MALGNFFIRTQTFAISKSSFPTTDTMTENIRRVIQDIFLGSNDAPLSYPLKLRRIVSSWWSAQLCRKNKIWEALLQPCLEFWDWRVLYMVGLWKEGDSNSSFQVKKQWTWCNDPIPALGPKLIRGLTICLCIYDSGFKSLDSKSISLYMIRGLYIQTLQDPKIKVLFPCWFWCCWT